MQIFYCDTFDFPLPPGHRFPLAKFRYLRERVAAARLVPPHLLKIPEPVTETELLRAHALEYVRRTLAGQLTAAEVRRLGFPCSPQLVERALRSAGATLAAARAALADGCAASLAGGTHHAGYCHGEGYCLFNDSIITLRTLQAEGRIRTGIVLDCDVHQGNGTAEIADGDSSIFTYSIHAAKNFPLRKHASDLDVELPDGADDELYLAELRRTVPVALERAGADFALFVAGADPYAGDRLGRLAVSREGLAARDRFVLNEVQRRDVPVAVTMAGGYAEPISATVEIQFATLAEAARRYHMR